MRDKLGRVLLPLVVWGLLWVVAAELVGKELLLPSPPAVFRRLAELAVTARFWLTAGATLLRVFGGLLLGVLVGVLLAGLTGAVRWCDWLFTPVIKVIRATPVASFILLLLLWVGRDSLPALISGLMVLPVVWGNVRQGIAQVDGKLVELCRAYGFSRWKTLTRLYLPWCVPYFTGGVKTGLGLAWKAGVAAEVLSVPALAIGTQIYYGKIYLETADLFAWTVVVIALSFLVEWGVKGLLDLAGRRWEVG